MRAVQCWDDVPFAVVAEHHGEHEASAWPWVVNALAVDQIADDARLFHCLFCGQFDAFRPVSKDFENTV